MEFTSTSNNVFSRFFNGGLHKRIRLGESHESFDELGQVSRVLGFDSNTHDRGHRELHGDNGVRVLIGGEGSRLEDELINSDQSTSVSDGDRVNGLSLTTHHNNSSLNVLDEQIFLLANFVVGSENSDLRSRDDGAREDTTEGEETSLISSGYHLRYVHNERSVGVAVSDGGSGGIIHRTSVQVFYSVFLGSGGGRQVHDHHFQEGLIGGQPFLHDALEELLLLERSFFRVEGNSDYFEVFVELLHIVGHTSLEDLADGFEDELAEGSGKRLSAGGGAVGDPLLGFSIKVVVTPESLGHLFLVYSKLFRVDTGKLVEGESPSLETGGEGNSSLFGVDSGVTEEFISVCGNDNVGVFDDTDKVLVHLFRLELEFKETTIQLVNGEDGNDTFSQSLTKDSFSLYANSFDDIDDDQTTISNTEGSSYFRRKVDVTWGVDQVDKKLVTDGVLGETERFGHLEVKRDTSGLDGNTSVLLVLTSISKTNVTGIFLGNDTSSSDERIGQSGLAVIDVSNDRHITDVMGLIHNESHLVHSKVHHFRKFIIAKLLFLVKNEELEAQFVELIIRCKSVVIEVKYFVVLLEGITTKSAN
jgi:hypothetical protein